MDAYDPFSPDFLSLGDWERIDYLYDLPDDRKLERFALAIEALHADQSDATSSWRTIENRVRGLKGERAFARVFGCKMDLTLKKRGNFRRNFLLRSGAAIDVVTRSMIFGGMMLPDLTIRHKAKTTSKMVLYLIVWKSDNTEPWHAGWIPEKEAHRVGRVEQYRSGIQNTVVSVGQLNDPRELLRGHDPESIYLRHRPGNEQDRRDIVIDTVREHVEQRELWEP